MTQFRCKRLRRPCWLLPANLADAPGRHRPEFRLMRTHGGAGLRGVNGRRLGCGPRVVPIRVDFLLAIGRECGQHCTKQRCGEGQNSACAETFGSVHGIASVVDMLENHGGDLVPPWRKCPWRGSELM